MPEWARKWSHIQYRRLVQMSETYIVFIDLEGDVDWESTTEHETSDKGKAVEHSRVLNEAALLETTPCHGLDDKALDHFKRLIAEAITRSFEHDYINADRMLAAGRAYHRARSEETSRLWYLQATAGAAAVVGVVAVVSWTARERFSAVFGMGALWLLLSASAGAFGALLSVITRTGRQRFDCASGRMLHTAEGASRILAGALSGLLVSLGIRSGMFLAPLFKDGSNHVTTLLAAFSAGGLERVASSILSSASPIKDEAPPSQQRTGNQND